MIEITLPDGSIATFPLGTPQEDIIEAVDKMFAGQSQEPVAPEKREPIGLGGQASLGATQAAFDAI